MSLRKLIDNDLKKVLSVGDKILKTILCDSRSFILCQELSTNIREDR